MKTFVGSCARKSPSFRDRDQQEKRAFGGWLASSYLRSDSTLFHTVFEIRSYFITRRKEHTLITLSLNAIDNLVNAHGGVQGEETGGESGGRARFGLRVSNLLLE